MPFYFCYFCFPKFLFFFSTGTISVRRKLKINAVYRLKVEARYKDVSSGYVIVIIRAIRATTPQKKLRLDADEGLKFPSPIYSVIIPYTMIVGQTILHLRVKKSQRLTNSSIRYRIQAVNPFYQNPFFNLNPIKGSLKIARELTELVSDEKPTSFVLQVIARAQEKPNVFAITRVSVVVVPEYAGNDYVKSSLEAVNNRSSIVLNSERLRSHKNGSSPDKTKSSSGQTEFSLHRLFRRPSREAQRISQADLKFNKIIREIKREVADDIIGEVFANFLLSHLENINTDSLPPLFSGSLVCGMNSVGGNSCSFIIQSHYNAALQILPICTGNQFHHFALEILFFCTIWD